MGKRQSMFLYGILDSSNQNYDSEFYLSNKRNKLDLITKSPISVHFVSTGNEADDAASLNKKKKKSGGSGIGLGLLFNSDGGSSGNLHDEDEDEDDDEFLPTAFGRKIKEGAQHRRQQREREREKFKRRHPEEELGGGGTGGVGVGVGVGVGGFEKHTKGIGMKLLEKMGYKGSGGLGKNEQGIVAPIEPKLRPKYMGMGFNSDYKENQELLEEEKKKSSLPPLPPPADSQRSKEKLWSKQARLKRNNKKGDFYVTAEELLARKQEQGGVDDVVLMKVFDMRGPQVRVLTNLDNLNAEDKVRENNDIPKPELQHNLRLIVDLAELDIKKVYQDLRYARETVVALHKEKENLRIEAARQKKHLDNMEEILRVLHRIWEENSLGTLTLDSLAKSFGYLLRQFVDDYKLCNLSCIACSFAMPLFIRVFQGWDPLQNPLHELEVITLWKNLLQEEDRVVSPYYTQLFMEVVFPAVRIFWTNTWQARDPKPMLHFLKSWEELLPPSALQTILDNVVMPKLSAAVDSWDPRCDMSAYDILSPWQTVFDQASWEQLMVRYIIPKLSALAVLHDFQVNPADQKLDPFEWVRTWVTAIPIHHMLGLMDLFFDKWLQFLYHWLLSNPNFEEVAQWYVGWKKLIPAELLANEHIRCRLNSGIDMMNQAVEGMEVAQPGFRAVEQKQFKAQQKAAALAQQQAAAGLGSETLMESMTSGGLEMSLKEVMEVHAQQNGLLLMPKPGRTQVGHQIYGFGSTNIIIDSLNQKIFAQNEENWSLVSLEQLLEMQNKPTRRKRA